MPLLSASYGLVVFVFFKGSPIVTTQEMGMVIVELRALRREQILYCILFADLPRFLVILRLTSTLFAIIFLHLDFSNKTLLI